MNIRTATLLFIMACAAMPAGAADDELNAAISSAKASGDYRPVETLLLKRLESHPEDSRLLFNLALAYAHEFKAPEARAVLDHARRADPAMGFASSDEVARLESYLNQLDVAVASTLPAPGAEAVEQPFSSSEAEEVDNVLVGVGKFDLSSILVGGAAGAGLAFLGAFLAFRNRHRNGNEQGLEKAELNDLTQCREKIERLAAVLKIIDQCKLISGAIPSFPEEGIDDLRVLQESVKISKSRLERSGISSKVSMDMIVDYETEAAFMFNVFSSKDWMIYPARKREYLIAGTEHPEPVASPVAKPARNASQPVRLEPPVDSTPAVTPVRKRRVAQSGSAEITPAAKPARTRKQVSASVKGKGQV